MATKVLDKYKFGGILADDIQDYGKTFASNT